MSAYNKRKRKTVIAISIAVAAVLLFFMSALIYNAVSKDKNSNGSGIVLGGDERGYENSVVLGEYRGIKYVPLEVNVTEEELAEYIADILAAEPNYVIDYVRDNTEIQYGDSVLLTYTLTVNNINYVTDESMIYVCGENYFGESFDSALNGTLVKLSSESSVEAEVTVPDDYHKSSIRGESGTVSFSVTGIVTVYDYLTNEYCNRVSDGKYKTVTDYENYCREQLERAKQSRADEKKWNDIWNTLRNSCELTIDEKSVEQEYQDMINYYESYSSYLGTTMEELVTSAYGYATIQDFYDYCREYSRTVVEERVIYDAIIEKENISVDDTAYNEKLVQYMEEAGYTNLTDFEEMVGKEQIIRMIESDMVSELLISSAVAVES